MLSKNRQSKMSLLLLLLVLLAVSIGRPCEGYVSACASCTGGTNNNNIPARFISTEQHQHQHQPQQQLVSRSRRSIRSAKIETDDEVTEETKFRLLDGSQAASSPIPVDFYRDLNNATDYREVFIRYADLLDADIQNDQEEEGISENYKRSTDNIVRRPRAASCQPDDHIVSLVPENASKDPSIVYVPSCTRVKRCTGCCGPQLSCQSTQNETIKFVIDEYKFGERAPRNKITVAVDNHLKCMCKCRIKEKDCNSYQTYDEKNCRCDCNNIDQKNKCNTLEHKIWDEEECRCVCRDSHTCTTGTVYDETNCQCVSQADAVATVYFRTNAETDPLVLDRKSFIVKPTELADNSSTFYITGETP